MGTSPNEVSEIAMMAPHRLVADFDHGLSVTRHVVAFALTAGRLKRLDRFAHSGLLGLLILLIPILPDSHKHALRACGAVDGTPDLGAYCRAFVGIFIPQLTTILYDFPAIFKHLCNTGTNVIDNAVLVAGILLARKAKDVLPKLANVPAAKTWGQLAGRDIVHVAGLVRVLATGAAGATLYLVVHCLYLNSPSCTVRWSSRWPWPCLG